MTDRLKAWLDEDGGVGHANWAKALAALRAVVELHARNGYGFCDECSVYGEYTAEWPCSTIRAVEKEVLGD